MKSLYIVILIIMFCVCYAQNKTEEDLEELKFFLSKIDSFDSITSKELLKKVEQLGSKSVPVLLEEYGKYGKLNKKREIMEAVKMVYDSNTVELVFNYLTDEKGMTNYDFLPIMFFVLLNDQLLYHKTYDLNIKILPILIRGFDNNYTIGRGHLSTVSLLSGACFEVITGDLFSERIRSRKGKFSELKHEMLNWYQNNKDYIKWIPKETVFKIVKK